MTYSIDVPMSANPSFVDVRQCVIDAFSYFGYEIPTISLRSGGDVYIEGLKEGDFCWMNINYFEPMAREVPEYEYVGSVMTRGNWWFAGVVVHAMAKCYGRIIFNDSGADLGEPGTYTVAQFENLLRELK